jgi:hypothetical protein
MIADGKPRSRRVSCCCRNRGWRALRHRRNADRIAGRGKYAVLDRDEDPERFGFWQGVWLTIAIIAAPCGLLACV